MAHSVAQPLLLFCNTPDCKTATRISEKLIRHHAAACVNILPAVRSIYRWQGKIESAEEVTLLIKTTDQRFDQASQIILAEHPYEVPEIIALPLSAGLPAYLRWITEQCDN